MELLRDYMNEHYAAARNQQMLRMQGMALYVSASSILFVQAILNFRNDFAVYTIGGVLILLAALCLYQNLVFHRTNRYHVEIARHSRKQITKILSGGSSLAQNDPNLIGEVVRSNRGLRLDDEEFEHQLDCAVRKTLKKSNFKVESRLHRSLFAIPVIIGFAGLMLVVSINWINEVICGLCSICQFGH
ncbi:hypothetical protein [Roseibium sp.]|uniref:hypothetical protein n=1 Tax=Roseibium sp. TaxID=1936156 RepID=UPI003A9739F9